MRGVVTNLLTWGVKELISSAVGGDGGSGGSSAGQAIAAQGKQTQEQLASISARQVMRMYTEEKNTMRRKGEGASRPPDMPQWQRKASLGIQLIQQASKAAVSDPTFAQLIQQQQHSLGRSISDDVNQVIQTNYMQPETDTETRVRQSSRGSFLDPSSTIKV